MRTKRRLAIIISCVYIAALLLFGVFISIHAGHDCTGEDCAICATISSCEHMLRTLAAMLIALGLCTMCAAALHARYITVRADEESRTLVSLKVKLTD